MSYKNLPVQWDDWFHPEILMGSPEWGHKTMVGCGKQAVVVVLTLSLGGYPP